MWALAAHKSVSPSTKPAPKAEVPAMVLREHLSPASVLTWVPNKNVLTSTCDGDDTIKLWDIDAFRYRQLPEYESTKSIKLNGTNIHLAWSPDGQYLAVANAHTSDFAHYIDIYQADLNKLASGFEQGILVPNVSVCYGLGWLQRGFPTAIWDASGSSVDAFYLGMWDITKPTQNPQPLLMQGMLTLVSTDIKEQALAIAPDGLQVAIDTYKKVLTGTVAIMDNKVAWLPSRPPLLTRKTIPNSGSADLLSWGSGGRRLMGILDGGYFTTIVGWDMVGQSDDLLRFGIPPDAPDFTTLVTHPSAASTMFAAGTADGQIYLWSGETRKLPLRTLASPDISAKVIALAWSSDGQWLAASYQDTDATILIWKV
jgi:WD40 repeat protein